METYQYYSVHPVHPKDMENDYSYLSGRDIPVGSYVEIPFGYNNNLFQGVVVSKGTYTRETAPYPVEKTKKILRVISEAEFNAGVNAAWVKEIRELEEWIAEEDFDAVLEWAEEHHQRTENPEIMRQVLRAYRLCAAQGDPDAALNLGTMYYTGQFVERDYRRAAELYRIAADAGYVRAVCNLGYCFYYGRHQSRDYEAAYRWFSLGAALSADPNCLYKLGDLYWNGYYVRQDRAMAERLYFRAMEECERPGAESFCRADILLRLGMVCLEGSARYRDAQRALEYLTQALSGFYDRRKTDPFVSDPIARAKAGIRRAEKILDRELIGNESAHTEKKPAAGARKTSRLLKIITRRLRRAGE